MSEENQVQEGQTEGTSQEVQLSEVEQAAVERGWKPKEEYSGDPTRWRSAEVFMALDEPLKRIEHQSKEMKQLRAALEAFQQHHTKVEASAFDRALASLKAERKQAMLDGDTEKVFELEEQADEVKDQRAKLLQTKPIVQDVPQPAPEFVEWQSKNSWYNSDKAMTAVADAYGKELHAQGYTSAQVLRQVSEKVKEDFPQKFKPKSVPAQAVEGSSRGGSRSDGFEMSQQEVDIMRKIVRSGAMTEAEYKSELKKTR